MTLKIALEAQDSSSELSLLQASPSPEQVATIDRSLCSSYQVASGMAQAAADVGLHPPKSLRSNISCGQFQTTPEHHSTTPKMADSAGTRTPQKQILVRRLDQPTHNSSSTVVTTSPYNQLAIKAPSNSNQGSNTPGGYIQPHKKHTWSTCVR